MLKVRLSLIMAGIAGALTLLFSFLNDARPLTLFYRSAISAFIFGLIGFVLGQASEKILNRFKQETKTKGQNVDIISEEPSVVPFSPLTPDMVERIVRPD
ncbi:hypothetical protein TcarDRAFT_2219 [Thermosinus carboxydivorans Nor1]|uniref:Uncharacterized protein n=1 Tax=Thermosinus carboxydivorans Nor1 TaxID=401526 RepID=A1HN11_9FIRM|nr:hypothetical protein [Thermosinus carboxydivorans]EAX48747.1 hypothetical protein TcarDRAFT_2219 [Thermosinus carboxydivorans Nor1]